MEERAPADLSIETRNCTEGEISNRMNNMTSFFELQTDKIAFKMQQFSE